MNPCNLYYQIVPIGDGCHYVGLDENNQPTLHHKKYRTPQTTNLLFATEQAAKTYIDSNLSSNSYKPEAAFFATEFLFNQNAVAKAVYDVDHVEIRALQQEVDEKEQEIQKLLSLIDNLNDDIRELSSQNNFCYHYNG